jgi:hypothetical protein
LFSETAFSIRLKQFLFSDSNFWNRAYINSASKPGCHFQGNLIDCLLMDTLFSVYWLMLEQLLFYAKSTWFFKTHPGELLVGFWPGVETISGIIFSDFFECPLKVILKLF